MDSIAVLVIKSIFGSCSFVRRSTPDNTEIVQQISIAYGNCTLLSVLLAHRKQKSKWARYQVGVGAVIVTSRSIPRSCPEIGPLSMMFCGSMSGWPMSPSSPVPRSAAVIGSGGRPGARTTSPGSSPTTIRMPIPPHSCGAQNRSYTPSSSKR